METSLQKLPCSNCFYSTYPYSVMSSKVMKTCLTGINNNTLEE
uniref:Uncharacterized protein n=1 Tax=Arundo donax TaxID=35708 RepID=A0A0A9G898_ARUDO